MMAFRIAWFKVHRPLAFYATFFTVRAKAFDAEYCCAGIDAVKQKIREIENNKDATAVEKNLMVTLEVCYEFYLRGFHFDTISIYDLTPPPSKSRRTACCRPSSPFGDWASRRRWTPWKSARESASSRWRSSPPAATSSPRPISSS